MVVNAQGGGDQCQSCFWIPCVSDENQLPVKSISKGEEEREESGGCIYTHVQED